MPPTTTADDTWLFGWDTTPGIVSVWADRSGRALVWQRDGEHVNCTEERFRPWMFSTTLDDLMHVGAAPNQADEANLIGDLCALIRERNPDVIENHHLFGFDLPFLHERARILGVPLHVGRPEGPPLLDQYEEPVAFRRRKRTRYSLAGRELIDTLDAVWRHDFSARDMPGHGLKAAARYFGIAAPERTYLAGAEVFATYQREPELVQQYALDDVAEVDGLSQRLLGSPEVTRRGGRFLAR